jgi:hypothetical protein
MSRRTPKMKLSGRVAVDQAKAQEIVQVERGLQPENLPPTLVLVTPPFRRYPTPSALLAIWFSVPHRYPGAQRARGVARLAERIRGIAKLDPFFERTSKLASRRLKREIERRGTLAEFALEPDPSTKRIPPEESSSDLFRSDDPDGVGGSGEVESPQSVMQGCPAQGSAVWSGEKE